MTRDRDQLPRQGLPKRFPNAACRKHYADSDQEAPGFREAGAREGAADGSGSPQRQV